MSREHNISQHLSISHTLRFSVIVSRAIALLCCMFAEGKFPSRLPPLWSPGFPRVGYRAYLIFPVNGWLFNVDCHRCHSYGKPVLSVICQCIIIMCHPSVRTNKTRKAFFVCLSKTKIVLNARTFYLRLQPSFNRFSWNFAEMFPDSCFSKGCRDFVISTWLKSYGLVCKKISHAFDDETLEWHKNKTKRSLRDRRHPFLEF